MSQANVEIIRQLIEAFNEDGMGADAAVGFFDADAVFEEPPEQPSPTVAVGLDAVVRTFEQFDEAWQEHRSDPEEIRAIDDERVLLLSTERFRGREGIELAQACGTLFTLRDGKVTRMQPFWERENALNAAAARVGTSVAVDSARRCRCCRPYVRLVAGRPHGDRRRKCPRWRAGRALCVFDELGIGEIPERRHVRSPERLRDRIERFLRSVGLLARDIHRGDLRLCCFAVEFLVDELVSLMFDEIERPPRPPEGHLQPAPLR